MQLGSRGLARVAVLVSIAGLAGSGLGAQAGSEPRTTIARAVAAMGGEQPVRGLRNTTVEFNAASFALGQEETPESPARATISFGRIVTDYEGGRRSFAQELRLVSGVVNRQRRVIASGMGMTETNGQMAMDVPPAVSAAQRAMTLQPERLLLAMLDRPDALQSLPARRWRGQMTDGVRYAFGPDTLSLYFDRWSGLLLVTEALADHPVLGDARTVTWYTRWQDAGGVMVPRQVDVELNGRLQSHTVLTSVSANGTMEPFAFAIPDSMAARAVRGGAGPAPVGVTLVELGPGVWRAEGGSHHSLVVEQPSGLIVVEAPQNAARVNAVLDTLTSRFAGRSVTAVVNTHHHWDHSGGVRAALARGLPVVTQMRNVGFIRGMGLARKTVSRDGLSRGGVLPVVRGVEDSTVLGAGDRRVLLYRIPSAHAEGILAAYVPSARLLFVSDVLTPGPTLPRAGCAELVAFGRARGIVVERVVGGHGGIAAWADVERAAAGS
jgi:glyoxylase-like metal-dependent hydrolase (beta-lactamase superfamily II)